MQEKGKSKKCIENKNEIETFSDVQERFTLLCIYVNFNFMTSHFRNLQSLYEPESFINDH